MPAPRAPRLRPAVGVRRLLAGAVRPVVLALGIDLVRVLQGVRHVGLAGRPSHVSTAASAVLLPVGAVVVGVALAAGPHHAIGALEAAEAGASCAAAEPWVAQGLVRGEAVARAHLQQAEDEVQGALGHILPSLLGEAEVTLDNLPVQLVQHVVEEGQRAAQQHVGDDTHCPDVYLTAILLLLNDLWGEVEVGAADRVRPRQAAGVVPRDPGKAEVGYLDVSVADLAGKEDVLGLEVTMHDAPAVDVRHGVEQLVAADLRLVLCIVLLLLDAVVELATLAELQDQPDAARQGLVRVDKAYEAGMVPEDLQDVDLLAYPVQAGHVTDTGVDDLQGIPLLRLVPAPAEVHHGELARADVVGLVHFVGAVEALLLVEAGEVRGAQGQELVPHVWQERRAAAGRVCG
mmetsp:Transcript_142863/g.397988  ORF Transcript_142863/g.397988 Transcript_142863/m.397988 type:complete len:403 (+) Transcript_142863:137-1345(+)